MKDVTIGTTKTDVNSSNASVFLTALQGLIGNTTVSGPVTRTLSFRANVQQTGKLAFEAGFEVIFTFTEAVYNGLVVTPERAFLESAVLIKNIGDAASNVSTSYNNIDDTFTITMHVDQVTFGTGIFSTLETLGVKDVTIGTTKTDVNSSSTSINAFISALESAFNSSIRVGDNYLVTMSFIGNINQVGYPAFSANFVVEFQMTQSVYDLFASEI